MPAIRRLLLLEAVRVEEPGTHVNANAACPWNHPWDATGYNEMLGNPGRPLKPLEAFVNANANA